jgi:hypothetical protein
MVFGHGGDGNVTLENLTIAAGTTPVVLPCVEPYGERRSKTVQKRTFLMWEREQGF